MDFVNENEPFTEFLSSAAFAIRSTFHTTLGATPGQLVFGRDMILPIKCRADWEAIRFRRQKEIDRNNKKENKRRVKHTYNVGDKVLITKEGILRKMTTPREGPLIVSKVYNNGTVEVQKKLSKKGKSTQRVNIRRLLPYHEKD